MKYAQHGFTLPEIMIGGAILAGVAVAGITIFKNQSKSQARVQHEMTLSQYHATLSKIIENDHNCNATFRSMGKFGAPSIGGTDDISSLLLCDTSVAGNCVSEKNASNTLALMTPFISENSWIDSGSSRQVWKLSKIEYKGSIDKTGILPLRVTYTMNPSIDSRIVIKDANLNLRFSTTGAGLQECFNNQESAVNNLQNNVCKNFYKNVSGDAKEGVPVIWDEVTQTCKLNGQATPATPLKDCSTSGLMVEGIRTDGTVNCRSIATGSKIAEKADSTPCAPNSKVSFEIVAGGNVKVKCGASTPPASACVGSWGSCISNTETYTVTSPGTPDCPFANGATRSCTAIYKCFYECSHMIGAGPHPVFEAETAQGCKDQCEPYCSSTGQDICDLWYLLPN